MKSRISTMAHAPKPHYKSPAKSPTREDTTIDIGVSQSFSRDVSYERKPLPAKRYISMEQSLQTMQDAKQVPAIPKNSALPKVGVI